VAQAPDRIRGLAVRHLDDAVVGIVALCVYILTLAPGVTTGDSGELITAAATLGLAHPTGYPLYILLGRVFMTVFFFLPPDLAMNLFSAMTAAAAALVVRRTIRVLTGDRIIAVGTALAFAFSASMWSQATTARVYMLNVLLTALILLELARLYRGQGGSVARGWFLFGLAMANHTVTVVLAPMLLAAAWKWTGSWSARFGALCLSIPGLALYLYIPISSSFGPYQNWGNPSNIENLIGYLSREEYWRRSFVQDVGDVARVAWHYLAQVPAEFTWIGTAVMALGVYAGMSRARVVLATGLYLFFSNIVLMIMHGSRSDIFFWSRYMLTGWLGLALISGMGMKYLAGLSRGKSVALVAAVLVPVAALALNYRESDRSGDRFARDLNQRILEMVEPDATVFAEGDNVLFPLIYLHHVEGIRPDVKLVLQGVNELSNMVIDPDGTPIYFTHHHNLGAPQLELLPDGLVYRLVRKGSGFVGRGWSDWSIPSFELIKGPGYMRYLDRNLVGDYLFMKAVNHEPDRESVTRALTRAMEVDPDNDKTFLNAGLIFERALLFEEAMSAFETARTIDPRDDLALRKTREWESVLSRVRGAEGAEDRASRLAVALYEGGRGGLAIRVLREAADAFKRSFKLRYNLAALLIARGDLDAAVIELEAALNIRPDDAVALRDLGQVRRLTKQRTTWYSDERQVFNSIPSSIKFAIGTDVTLDPESITSDAWSRFEEIERVFDAFDPDSEVGRLNTSMEKGAVPISPVLADVLRDAFDVWEATDHAFDVTVFPLKGLWRDAARKGAIPGSIQKAGARSRVGMSGIHLSRDGRSLTFDTPGVLLDFGGIVKGHAVDLVIERLKQHGASSALVRCGGEIRAFGAAQNGDPWTIGVRHPLDRDGTWGVVSGPTELAVSTSGNYEQPVVVGGREFHHVFDPRKGEPASTDVLGVTVVITGERPSCAIADATATALTVLGPSEGLDVIVENEGTEALFIMKGRPGETPYEKASEGMRGIYRKRR